MKRRIARRGDAGAALEPLEHRSLLAVAFGPVPVISDGVNFYPTAVADFDGDGIADLVGVGALSQRRVYFFRGRNDGSFEDPVATDLNVRAARIAAADFFAGGGAELVAVGGAGRSLAGGAQDGSRATYVRVLRFDSGSGGLVVAAVTAIAAPAHGDLYPSVPLIGDFTGDGTPDIALAPGVNNGRVVVVERAGSAGLRVAQTVVIPTPRGFGGHYPVGPEGADLNGDGRLDAVISTDSGYVALMNGPSGLAHTVIQTGLSQSFEWKVADVNGDHIADAVSQWTPPAQERSTSADRYTVIRVKTGNGDGTFGAIRTIAQVRTGDRPPDGVYGALDEEWLLVGPDVDGDGQADITYIRNFDVTDRSAHIVRERIVTITHASGGAWNPPHISLGPNEVNRHVWDQDIELLNFGTKTLVDVNGDGMADLVDTGYTIRTLLASSV